MRMLNDQPATTRGIAFAGQNVTVPGIGDPVDTIAFRGASAHFGLLVIAGRWFAAPGEVLAPRALMQDAHLKIRDSFTGTFDGQPRQLRAVEQRYASDTTRTHLCADRR